MGFVIQANETVIKSQGQDDYGKIVALGKGGKLDSSVLPDDAVNQNAFSNVLVNGATIVADSQNDTLELAAGTNISLIADTTNKKVTIAVTGKVASAAQSDSATSADTLGGKSVGDIIATCSPAGMVQYFATQSAPGGWLKADGTAVSRIDYADLFAAIETLYGEGDGSTTFNLPDLRGEFVRGFDDGRGVDSGRELGSLQIDELKSHNHLCATYNGLSGIYETAYTAGGYDYGNEAPPTTSVGGSETRPRNIALLACIKY